jgi:hypothetical protein
LGHSDDFRLVQDRVARSFQYRESNVLIYALIIIINHIFDRFNRHRFYSI